MRDIEGNIVEKGDIVYACHNTKPTSKSKRLFRCEVREIPAEGTCRLFCPETQMTFSKTSATIIKPVII